MVAGRFSSPYSLATTVPLPQELDVRNVDVQAVLSVVRYGLNGDAGGFICLNYCQ